MLKHYKIGVEQHFVFLLLKEKKKAKKMITGISGLVFFVQEWPFRDAYLFFNNKLAETPIFIVFLGARFLGQGVKKGYFGHPPKKEKID